MTTTSAAPDRRHTVHAAEAPDGPWWRHAVIYQVYPRSFADSNGDGIGDLPGITARLPHLAELGVDALWLSPFYVSPQADAGYDVADYRDVDPVFGTLSDLDALLDAAHRLGLRVIVDLVPNHTSDQHVWFAAARAAAPGSPERGRYLFREGRGEHGELPPNNWVSMFGGPAWTRVVEADGRPGQWYLHLFDSSQPDLDWSNPQVRDEFEDVLRFWLDRGVDGFRVDVAHGLVKADGLPDWDGTAAMIDGSDPNVHPGPMFDQEGVHEIYRSWRTVLDSYPGDRAMVAEAWVEPVERLARYVRSDEMHQAFNFAFLSAGWDPVALRTVIDRSFAANDAVGAPTTWVMSNHDVVRHASRLGLTDPTHRPNGIGEGDEQPDAELGLRRARAISLLVLALPGSAYLYQGEELGLPEHTALPDELRQDPAYFRTRGAERGRDGCRVPLPWEPGAPAFGFSPTGASWLPQPADWGAFTVEAQRGVDGSTYETYRRALALRREHAMATADLTWRGDDPQVLTLSVGDVLVVANMGDVPVTLPAEAKVLLSSAADMVGSQVPPATTVWARVG
ncbi:glycoside hydrolase family 13 protein [Cellulomonas citrea]|uniref:glycoside hydrolase family 13 protein n=1 Tax=Cellulomonas citrea TaxID=1909423 RepID=UPI0013580A95|nr:glycoside hydrolase family 13 protein [Cellulomonas citrea]